MRNVSRATAMAAFVLLSAFTCSPGGGTTTANNSPASSASAEASPSSLPSSSPTGAESPPASPSPSPTAAPTPLKLIISALTYHVGEVSIGYSQVTASGSGGTPPYTWSVGGGALPPGLTMSSAGTVSGTPTLAGGFSFVVLLQDSGGQAAGVARTISVAAHLNAAGICVKICQVETGCTNVCGTYTALSGGVSPFKFAVTSGSLPPGMSLNGTGLTGAFPTSRNTSAYIPWTFGVTVTDALGATSIANAAYLVYPHIAFWSATAANCGNGTTITSCSLTVFYYQGVPGATASVVIIGVSASIGSLGLTGGCTVTAATTAPPPGMTTAASGGAMTLTAGPPSGGWCSYTGTITFSLTDSDPCGPTPGIYCTSTNTYTVTFAL